MVEYLLKTNRGAQVARTLEAADTELHTPALCDVEFAAGLRRALLLGTLSGSRAGDAIQDYLDLSLTRHGHQALLARMLELRPNFSAYDATYVALAEQLGAKLLTMDTRLAKAARRQAGLQVL